MQLHEVLSGFYAEPSPSTCMILQVRVTLDEYSGQEDVEFVYRPDDPYGLSPDITEWLASHPEFVIAPYDPNRG